MVWHGMTEVSEGAPVAMGSVRAVCRGMLLKSVMLYML